MTTGRKKYKNENSRLYHSSKDWGWMFSHTLMERVIAKTGMPRRDVERLFLTLGSAMRELLVTGVPVGFPYSPVLYARRSGKRNLRGKKTVNRDVARCCVRTSYPFRIEMQQRLIDRGDIRAQYDRERTRVTGFNGLAFRPRKQQQTSSGRR